MSEGAKVLETVLAYFMDVLNIIKEFFAKLFPQETPEENPEA